MFCASCGQEAVDEARFCANCGADLRREPEAGPSQPFEQQAGGLPRRDWGGLIGETFSVYRSHPWPFVLIAVFPEIPFLLALYAPDVISVVLFVIGLVALSLASAASVHAVAQHYLHQEIDVARCYARAWGKVISLIVAGILVILALGGAVILSFIIIGIPLFFYLAVSWSVFVPAIVLDGETATGALGRSRTLVKGSWWRVFGISIVLWFIVFGLYVAVFIALEIVGLFNTAVGNILSSAATILIFPIFPIALTLLYIDLRVRKEQYSLRMMTSEIGPELRRPDNLPRRDL